MRRTKALRIALTLQIAGLILELLSLLRLTPATFMLFLGAGAPLIGLGCFIYLFLVIRDMIRKEVL